MGFYYLKYLYFFVIMKLEWDVKCIKCIDNDINDKDSGFVRKKILILFDFKIMFFYCSYYLDRI